MLVTNGFITRNIAESQLVEYVAKGYKPVPAEKPSKAKKGVVK